MQPCEVELRARVAIVVVADGCVFLLACSGDGVYKDPVERRNVKVECGVYFAWSMFCWIYISGLEGWRRVKR